MEKIVRIEDGVEKLLAKLEIPVPEYGLVRRTESDMTDLLNLEGKRIPLLWWRYHEKINSIYDFARTNPGSCCCLNVYSFAPAGDTLKRHLYRELDIAEYILGSEADRITAFAAGEAMNAVVVMKNGTVANLELGATLPAGSEVQCQHRLITTNGMANDRSVDTVTVQSAINLFSDSPKPDVYTDIESWLYGLTPDEVNKTYCITGLMRGLDKADDYIAADKRLRAAVKAAFESSKSGNTCKAEA